MSEHAKKIENGNDLANGAGATRLHAAEAALKQAGIDDMRFSLAGMRKHSRDTIYGAVAEVLEAVLRAEGK
ncbi:MAG: hypothetical protein WDM91_15370 [Rhizomicrobium sp.]